MDVLVSGFTEAVNLIVGFDPYVMEIISVSMRVSGIALIIAAVIGIPIGALLGLTNFPGKNLVVALLYTGMGFPPVVVGLIVFIILSNAGPLGSLDWLYTPNAIIIAQSLISFPLVAGFTMTAVMGVDKRLLMQLKALGATKGQALWATVKEARLGVLVSIIAGFGAVISEVGAVMMVGGNIRGSTRVLTTAVVLETRQGNFGVAMAFGLILLLITFVVNFVMLHFQGRKLMGRD
ncbi:ABC transporter permease [Natranaerofaba carboxydovora]|uniref:ABC transporter permease n=1 Tax=Natranaerofaba carboxydovora TaxID=2742683 RepID=UPI001F139D3F|nr:ABC transporter permease [Natranaerofaba carboxydovora]UMZ75479.1 Tungstate uptake system permease protein TupB [Natranaerofaba carboxydovora]